MESITSVKIFHGSEYKANGKVIRWTEVGLWVCQPSSGAGTAAPPVTTGKQCMLPLEPVVPLLPAQGAAGWDPDPTVTATLHRPPLLTSWGDYPTLCCVTHRNSWFRLPLC